MFVVTRQPLVDDEDVHVVRDPREGLQAARAAAGDRYVNVLGAQLARQCLDLGEVDEVLTIVAPVMLGGGTRLFEHPQGRRVQLERLQVQVLPHVVNMWHRVVQEAESALVT